MDKYTLCKIIHSFSKLENNWMGYGGEPISKEVIEKSIKAINELDIDTLPDSVVPTGRNSIQLEWNQNDAYMEMEIFEDKVSMLCMKDE